MLRFATPEGTRRYAARFARGGATPLGRPAASGHFREQPGGASGWLLSSLGIGTYLGAPDARTDQAYTEAIGAAVSSGINVIDTAINYRFQRSERAIGAALKQLAAQGFLRDEIIVCTKGGYLTPDGEMPDDLGEYFFREYIEPGVMRVDEVVSGSHCMTPRYLENQLSRSLANLGLDGIDVYYLHNPETQLGTLPREEFRKRVRSAFEFLESAVKAEKICFYGLATWNGFRQAPASPDYLSLAELHALATAVAGEDHHFRFVQLPYNLAMTEAITRANQELNDRQLPMTEAARALDITLAGSAALLQGQVARNLPVFIGEVLGLENDVQRALQFARSSPGMTTALVGMSRVEHVRENLKLIGIAPAPREILTKLFERRRSA